LLHVLSPFERSITQTKRVLRCSGFPYTWRSSHRDRPDTVREVIIFRGRRLIPFDIFQRPRVETRCVSIYLPLYKSITHRGGSASSLKLTSIPRLFIQRQSYVGPAFETIVL